VNKSNDSAKATQASRGSQRDRLLRLFRSRVGEWIPLPEILAMRIAQYSSRVFELRSLGYRIENKREGDHTFFRLLESSRSRREDALDDYGVKQRVEEAGAKGGSSEHGSLFPDEPLSYRDPEEGAR
jgi:hypothetical protein